MSANSKAFGIRNPAFGIFAEKPRRPGYRVPHAGCLLAFLILTPSFAQAQASAPGLYGVQEAVVQFARFDNPKAADACGLTREHIAGVIDKALQNSGVPAIPVTTAKPPMMGVARIELVPEISSFNDETLDCTSWVSLTAESEANIAVPPVPTLRNVTVVYWHKGAMVASGQASHSQKIDDMIRKMASDFAQQYRVDQPPKLPQQ